MRERTTILVNELRGPGPSPYTVCHECHGRHSIIEHGVIRAAEDLYYLQLQHEGSDVIIDSLHEDTRLGQAARHYQWELTSFKRGDYPYIEMINQLATRLPNHLH